MGLWRTLATSLFHRGGGFWTYMTERTKSRTAIELEKERNTATVNVIPLLPPGTDFMESEDGGRTRVIRTAPQSPLNGSSEGSATVPSPIRADERDGPPSARSALGQANHGPAPTIAPHGRQDELPAGELPR